MAAALAAFLRSASSQMIIGSEPPSSSVTRLEPAAASACTRSPTGVEPVKATLRTRGCVHERLADDGARAREDVEDAVGQPGRLEDLGQAQRRERRRVRGLGHDGVAGQERGAELVAQQRRGEVPGHDRGDDAERAAQHARVDAGVDVVHGDAAHLAGEPRVVLERVRGLVQLDLGLADRLALLGHEDRRKLVDVRLEGLRARVDDLAAVGVAEPRPALERRARGLHGAVGVLRRRLRHAAHELARARVGDLALLAGQRLRRARDERAVLDQRLDAHRVSSSRLTMLILDITLVSVNALSYVRRP